VREVVVAGIEKLVTHHAIYQPKDLMMAQYSIPFCIALSLYFDPTDPECFDQKRLQDKKVLAMMPRVRLKVDSEIEQKGWDRAARVTVDLGNRERHSRLVVHFKGTPQNPLSRSEVEGKARKLTRLILSQAKMERLLEAVRDLEKIADVSNVSNLLR
jgi:2-methylcitrate dehydratase PrpD